MIAAFLWVSRRIHWPLCWIGIHDMQDGHPHFSPDTVVCWRCGKVSE